MNLYSHNTSALFFAASVLYYFLGIYGFSRNVKNPTHKMFFIVYLAVSLWTISCAVSIAVSAHDTAALWRYCRNIPDLIPILLIVFAAVHFLFILVCGLLRRNDGLSQKKGIQFEDEARTKIFTYLAISYILAVYITFGVHIYLGSGQILTACIPGFSMLMIGALLFILQQIEIRYFIKELVTGILMAISILLVNLYYMNTAALYAWVLPAFLILISGAFRSKVVLAVIDIVTIFSFVVIWIMKGPSQITFTHFDHFLRIVVFLAVFWISSFVHRIYRQRLIQSEAQIRMQTLNARVSAEAARITAGNFDEQIGGLMEMCAEHFRSDRLELIFFPDEYQRSGAVYEWHRPGIPSIRDEFGQNQIEPVLRTRAEAEHAWGDILVIPSVGNLDDGSPEKVWMTDHGIRALIQLPMYHGGKCIGYLMFQSMTDKKPIPCERQQFFQMIAQLLSDTWRRVSGERALMRIAYHDGLTGLYNRAWFTETLDREAALATEEAQIGVLSMDVDFFQAVNDLMGHSQGDLLLKQISHRIRSCIGPDDVVGRFGGDVFTVLLKGRTSKTEITDDAQKIIDAMREPIEIDGQEVNITVSIGIAVAPDDGENAEDLIRNADLSLLLSKQTGKNKLTVCSADVKTDYRLRNEMIHQLYRTVERGELFLEFQPKVETVTGDLAGAEVLVRWRHPINGVVLPGRFIPLAEQTGMIGTIDTWVFEAACKQLKAWRLQGLPALKLSVNLSLSQFYAEGGSERIDRVMKENGVAPELIEIEITESIAYYNPKVIVGTMHRYKALGVSLALDDFGVDYSSLSRLHSLPIDRIKIDRQFIQGIASGKKGEDILKAIIALSGTLHLKTTAEGVETEEEYDFVRRLGCDEVQGYFFYRPMTAEKLTDILKHSTDLAEKKDDILK